MPIRRPPSHHRGFTSTLERLCQPGLQLDTLLAISAALPPVLASKANFTDP